MVSPTKRSPRVGIAPAYRATGRKQRRPQHRFNLKTKPYVLQPFMIAPVLPGESIKSLMIQAQTWSDPLAAGVMKNIGWWNEYFFFYVRHKDLAGFEAATDGIGKDLIDMFVTGESLSGHVDADGNTITYCPPNGIDFTFEALKRITEEYFRDEGEAWNVATLDTLPLAKIFGRGTSDWAEKLTLSSDYEDRTVDVPEKIDDLQDAYTEWAAMYDSGLVDMDYDDWMRTYGSSASPLQNTERPELHIPENICHFRDFQMPTNTVEPTTGVPATAVGWRTAKRTAKPFFCNEPGWIIGITCARPKVYYRYQKGSVASMMMTRESWLPAIMAHHLDASHLFIDDAAGPLAGNVGAEPGYWIDLKDLLNHGDQFINWIPADAPPFVDLPSTAGARRYPSAGDCMQFFSDTVNGRFLTDGVVSLSILGRQLENGRNLVLGAT